MKLILRRLFYRSDGNGHQEFNLEITGDQTFHRPASTEMWLSTADDTLWCDFDSGQDEEVDAAQFNYVSEGDEFHHEFYMKNSPSSANPYGHLERRRREQPEKNEIQTFEIGTLLLQRLDFTNFELFIELLKAPGAESFYRISAIELVDEEIILFMEESDSDQLNNEGEELRISFDRIQEYPLKCKFDEEHEEILGDIKLGHS